MNLTEYASYDALGLAELVARRQVTPKELALTAVAAKEKVDGAVNSVVELYPDRIDGLDEASLGNGPFRGVPFLIKDVFGHEKGRKIEFGSRLCQGMTVEAGTYFVDMLKAAGCKRIKGLFLVAAPEGLRVLEAKHPDVEVYTASVDERLNEVGYILPGLGDAGDKIFGTRHEH